MSTWTVAPTGAHWTCGFDGKPIADGSPVQEICLAGIDQTLRPRRRCVEHAHGPVDEAQLETARKELARREERAAIQAERMPQQSSAPPKRHTPHRPPRSFTKVSELAGGAFDPKLAAAGDHD